MTGSNTTDKEFYTVKLDANAEGCTHCGHNQLWTVVYTDDAGEEVQIGSSWGDEETAEDICGLMNMAFDAGREAERVCISQEVQR